MLFSRLQDQARRRSLRLLLLYAAALAATVGTVSAVAGSLILLLVPGAEPFWSYAAPALFFGAMTAALSLHRIRRLGGSGAAVAEALGGERLRLEGAPFAERRLLNVVAETAVAAGLPVPPVYLLRRDSGINAFAAGDGAQAVLGFTQGALERLTRDELQAVAAHEFSHILHGDTRLNQRMSGWLYGLQGIASSGRYLLYGRDEEAAEYRSRKNVDNHPFDNGLEILMSALPVQAAGALLLVLGAAGSLSAGWVQAAVSRQREFLADAAAVQFTRQTGPLVEALRKTVLAPEHGLHSGRAAEYAHMMFADITGSRLAATHPPVLERIRRLDPQAAHRLAPQIEAAEADGLTLFPHYGAVQRFTVGAADSAADSLAGQEAEYRRREALMRARIKRHRAVAAKLHLPAGWQAAAHDGEHASAALLCLFQAHRLPETQLRDAGIGPFVRLQVQRLSRSALLPDAELLEHLLPAWMMQESAARQAVLAVLRDCVCKAPPGSSLPELWLLLCAYLAPAPARGTLAHHPEAGALASAAVLPLPALERAVRAALLLDEAARVRLLHPLSHTLPATRPLLWRFLCVRLDLAVWHFGI